MLAGRRLPSDVPSLRQGTTWRGRIPCQLLSQTARQRTRYNQPHSTCRVATVESYAETDVAINQFPGPSPGSFLPDKRSFREEHRIRGYEVSPDQRATVVTVANLLQEVAGNHAVGLWGRTDEGFASLPGMNKTVVFVMTRLQIRMYQYPKWGDIVGVETYYTEEGRLAFRRDWKITDASTGAELGAATSTWVTINMDTRRLAKIPDTLRRRFLRFAPEISLHALPVAETKKKLPEMVLPGQVARRSDMDMNGHINNVTYLAWALESVPENVYWTHELYEVELDFKAECLAGNTVEAHCNFLDDELPLAGPDGPGSGQHLQLLHLLQKCDEGGCTELVRARTTWRAITKST
uniref:Acyl-[acyl-carrier-protein] hydrolase n=1 Tax=Eudorina sp. NIES-3984 TaxID=1941220 RepID=A0A2Z5X8I3_9CHLO|nr:acyl carrier protein thioesterase [Eudorina sp. NIES-3984]